MKRRIIDTLLLGVITVSTITLGSCQEITTSEKNIERKSQQGSIEKVIETTKYQSEKTLWDFLELTGILAVPFVIFIVGLLFKQIENKKNRNNLAEEAIQAYVDHMSDLLLNKECKKKLFPNVNDKLNPSGYDNPVRDVARTQTITILRRLEEDKEHQEIILNFLRDAELYEFIFKNTNLSKLNLSGRKLRRANLSQAELNGTNLFKADLFQADLSKINPLRAKAQKDYYESLIDNHKCLCILSQFHQCPKKQHELPMRPFLKETFI